MATASLEACIKCGNPADVELECWHCDGRGTSFPIGVYQPQTCQTCGGRGKLAYCKAHAGTGARLTPSSRARDHK